MEQSNQFMRKSIILILALCLLLPMVSAATDIIFTQDLPADIKVSCLDTNNSYCLPSTYCEATIHDPDMENLVLNGSMTYNPTYWNYTLNENQTAKLGEYPVAIRCEGSNETAAFSTFSILVTENGDAPPTGIVVITFSILFFVVLFMLLGSFFLAITDLGYREFRLKDVIIPIATFLGLILFNYLSQIFFPKELILNLLTILMKVTVWTHVALPIIAFGAIVLLEWNRYNADKDAADGYVPINTNMDFYGGQPPAPVNHGRPYPPGF